MLFSINVALGSPISMSAASYSYSYSPVISADGSKLFVAWVDNGDYDGDGSSDYDIVWSVSNDNGKNFA